MQEDKVADFTNNLALFVTVNSDIILQVSAQEEEDQIFNKNIILLALLIKYMEKQKRVKTNIEKQAVLLDILYKLINKATRYLYNILLKLYKETSLLFKSPYCCFNCNNLLHIYKKYNIIILYTKNIAKRKYLKDLFVSIKK